MLNQLHQRANLKQNLLQQSQSANNVNDMIHKQKQTIIKIYTDWANHYLKKRYQELDWLTSQQQQPQNEKHNRSKIPGLTTTTTNVEQSNCNGNKNRKYITSLVNDLQDGTLLVYIVESVTDSTLPTNTTYMTPKNQNQMIANIENCLQFLNQLGVNIDGIHSKDINEGNLKAILTLFFNISRFKQTLKQHQQQQQRSIKDNQLSANSINGNINKNYYSNKNANNSGSCTEDDYDDYTSGCLTDFSISSSTQSLSLLFAPSNTAAATTITTANNIQPMGISKNSTFSNISMAPSTASGSRLPNLSNGVSKLAQPTSIPIPGKSANNNQKTSSTSSYKASTSNLSQPSSGLNPRVQSISQQQQQQQNQRGATPPSQHQSSSSRPSRPQSTSSIPQIGANLSSAVIKPAVIQQKTVNNNKSSSNNSTPYGSSTKLNTNGQSQQSNKTKTSKSSSNNSSRILNPSQSEINLRSKATATASTTTTTNQPAANSTSSAVNKRLQLRRLPPPSSIGNTSNGVTTRRPISTIIESTATTPTTSIPSTSIQSIDKMSTSCPSSTSVSTTTALNSSAGGKPTATVKAMVTSVTSTESKQSDNNNRKLQSDNSSKQKGILRTNKSKEQLNRQTSTETEEELDSKSSNTTTKPKINLVINGNSGNSSEDGACSEDLETPPTMPPVMERPLQTISYLKANTNQISSPSSVPTVMYRKPENHHVPQARPGRSHYEPLYSNGQMSIPQPNQSLHRLSQGADYYGSDRESDSQDQLELKNKANHLSGSSTLINLHIGEQHLRKPVNNQLRPPKRFGFDETSSELSSEPGHMCSGTRTNTTTTATTSSTSSSSLNSDKRQSNKTDIAISDNHKLPTSQSGEPVNTIQIANNNNKIMIGQSGTLPVNFHGESSIFPNKNNAARFLNNKAKLRTQNMNQDSSLVAYSDSECVPNNNNNNNQRSSTFSLHNSLTNKILNPPPKFASNSKDGVYGELLFSNRIQNPTIATTTDTDSIDSLNTIGSDRGSLLSGQFHHQRQQSNSSNTSTSTYPIYANGPLLTTHHSKPGDLIGEYESLNRLRETMSASPTHQNNQKMAMSNYSDNNNNNNINNVTNTNGPSYLGRSGSFRLPSANHHHGHHHLPPIPAHLTNKLRQQQNIGGVNGHQSDHSASSLSLMSSNSSSIFTTPEEKYIHEIRRLRRELDQANEKIYTLTSQLTANAHMVAAFEQSLSSMTTRLQHLSSTSELKDCELERLRKTIDNLKKQGGSLAVAITSQQQQNHQRFLNNQSLGDKFQRYLSSESVCSLSSCGGGGATISGDNPQHSKSNNKKKSKLKLSNNTSWIRSSFNKAFKKKSKTGNSTNNRDAASDVEMPQSEAESTDVHSVPSSPMMSLRMKSANNIVLPLDVKGQTRSLSDSNNKSNSNEEPEEMKDLKKQLREKEMQLTDMRLESLTSAHQLENLKEIVNQMRVELMNLKQDNDRLQRLVNHKSLASSQSSMTSAIGSHGSSTVPSMTATSLSGVQANVPAPMATMEDSNSFESVDMENVNSSPIEHKLVTIGSGSHNLASIAITSKTSWEQLDSVIKKTFKDHLLRVDNSLTLGVTVDSLACYRVGHEKITRHFYPVKMNCNEQPRATPTQNSLPELLPFGYLTIDNHINLQFKSTLDSLAFDTLTPKSVLTEFIQILQDSRRLIFAGPSGTGKTYLAHKIAEYLAIHQMDNNSVYGVILSSPSRGTPSLTSTAPTGAIATFNVDHKNTKELRAYLTNISEQCHLEVIANSLPTVIILDNLHYAIDSLEDIFNDLQKISTIKSPFIIGTINQSVHHSKISQICQLHEIRWVMLSVNSEAVRGYLNRFLKRKLIETEAKFAANGQKLPTEIVKIIEWIPKVYAHLNRFLENYFGETISIGARLFTSCPIDLNGSQAWFTDLWNYSILPFIVENLRENVRQNGGKLTKTNSNTISFIDPTDWIVSNYPWTSNAEWSDHLNRLRLEDVEDLSNPNKGIVLRSVGQPISTPQRQNKNISDADQSNIKDPFLQMLLKLKEASEYSSQDLSSQESLNHLQQKQQPEDK